MAIRMMSHQKLPTKRDVASSIVVYQGRACRKSSKMALTLGTTTDSLSVVWQRTLRNHYGQWVQVGKKGDKKDQYDGFTGLVGSNQRMPGKKVLSDENAGNMNICPVLSPNGKYVVYLSEKNLLTVDLYLADAKTGKILKKVASASQDAHIDQFNAI